jgi:hypothetical protein
MEPESAVQLYSAVLPRVKHVHKLVFKQCMLLAFYVKIVSCGGLIYSWLVA